MFSKYIHPINSNIVKNTDVFILLLIMTTLFIDVLIYFVIDWPWKWNQTKKRRLHQRTVDIRVFENHITQQHIFILSCIIYLELISMLDVKMHLETEEFLNNNFVRRLLAMPECPMFLQPLFRNRKWMKNNSRILFLTTIKWVKLCYI